MKPLKIKKKKFKDRKIGIFLKQFAPEILEDVSDLIPDFGALKLVGKMIAKNPSIDEKRKAEAAEIIVSEIKKNVIHKNITNSSIALIVAGMFATLIGLSETCLTEIVNLVMQLF